MNERNRASRPAKPAFGRGIAAQGTNVEKARTPDV
jgi:hypothetical protein